MLYSADQEIVGKASNGDVEAFRRIVERNQEFVYRVAYCFVNNVAEAEDITQECFIRLWKNLHRYRPEIKLTTWLYKIVTNLCLDFSKSRQTRVSRNMVALDDYDGMGQVDASDQPLIDAELRIAIEAVVNVLAPKQKAVFVLRDIEQVEMPEIAEILAMDAGQVKSNLYYARKKVSEMITYYYQTRKEAKQ